MKSVADFLMYLFQARKLQPSTIDGYRSAFTHKLGNSPINVSKDETHLSSIATTETDSKRGGASPPETFEPIKEASLKHLTFKTVFLLALGSGKRVSLYPSPSFLSKNQLAKEGPDNVAPMVIPALAPTLDKSLRSHRYLCATILTGLQISGRIRR